MTKAELNELREAWARAVTTRTKWFSGLGAYEPDAFMVRPAPCWFGRTAETERRSEVEIGPVDVGEPYGPCDGPIEGAHWIKRQTVERWIRTQMGEAVVLAQFEPELVVEPYDVETLVALAAWDPRNGVPACERHHRIFDSQRVPLPSEQIVIWRHQVPAHVEAFATDWGLEHELDRKHDTIGGGI